MPTAKSILAATDFSGTSREALHVARELAEALDARLHLLHVIPDPARLPWSVDTGLAFRDLEKDWRHHAELALAHARDEAGLPRVLTPTIVAMGDAATEIVATAAAIGAAIIVMGTHGHGFAARLVMGSVADKVLRHADRPVLIVPHPSLKHLEAAAEAAAQGAAR